MMEGWHNDEYFVLFDEAESGRFTTEYGLQEFLPGCTLIGLTGWDELIVVSRDGEAFRVPSVPLTADLLEPFDLATLPNALVPDERLVGKIKWYINPIAFAGDPQDEGNITWVPINTHAELVKWWNQTYRKVRKRAST
jgi:hypothetical protein